MISAAGAVSSKTELAVNNNNKNKCSDRAIVIDWSQRSAYGYENYIGIGYLEDGIEILYILPIKQTECQRACRSTSLLF